jgi:hypothetical protein
MALLREIVLFIDEGSVGTSPVGMAVYIQKLPA